MSIISQFDLKAPGGMVLPKRMICKECNRSVPYSPSTSISYANRRIVVDNLCDECVTKKVNEGRAKLVQLKQNIQVIQKVGYEKVKADAEKNIANGGESADE